MEKKKEHIWFSSSHISQAGYVTVNKEVSVSEELFARGVCSPSDSKMTENDVERTCKMIRKVLKKRMS